MLINKHFYFDGGTAEIADIDSGNWYVLEAVWVKTPDHLDADTEALTQDEIEAFNDKYRADILSEVADYYAAMREYQDDDYV